MNEIRVPVKLEVLQDSINNAQRVLNNLQPNTSGYKAIERILNSMITDAQRLSAQLSRPFTSESQFKSANKTLDKLEESSARIQVVMDNLQFSDLKLTPEQQSSFDELNEKINEIKSNYLNLTNSVKQGIMGDANNAKLINSLFPNNSVLSANFSEIKSTIDQHVADLNAAVEKQREAYEKMRSNAELAGRANVLTSTNGGISRDTVGKAIFDQFLYQNQFGIGFKKAFDNKNGTSQFLQALEAEFKLEPGALKELIGKSFDEINQALQNYGKANAANNPFKGLVAAYNSTNYAKSLTLNKDELQNLESQLLKYQELQNKLQILQNQQITPADTQAQTQISSLEGQLRSLEQQILQTISASGQLRQPINELNPVFNQLKTSIDQTNAQFLQMQRTTQSFNQMRMAVVNFMGFSQVLNLTRNAVRGAIDHIRELDTVMNGISIVTDMSTGDLWQQVDAYSKMAQSYGVSIKGAYEVSQIYYQQGLETADVMTLTNETLKLAKISGLDYATTTDYMTTALRGFKIEMQDAARVVDVYSALAANTAVSQEELAVAMSKTASSMEGVGSTFEEASAMIGTMVAVTRESATNIGSAMKSIASRYGELTKDPTKLVDEDGEAMAFNRVDAALQSVGISMKTVDGQFRNFTDVIIELGEKWNELDSTQQRYIATQFAGNRQQSRFLALVSNVDMLKSNLDVAMNSEDTGTLQALKALDSIEAKTEQVRVAYQQFYTTVGAQDAWKVLLDSTRSVIDTLNGLPKLFKTIPIGAIAGIANIVTLIRTVLSTAISGIAKIWTSALNNTAQTASSSGEKIGSTLMSSIKSSIEAGAPAVQAAIKAALSIDQQQVTNTVNPLNAAQQALYQSTKQNGQNIPVQLGDDGNPIIENPDYWKDKAKQYADNGMMTQEAYQNAAATGQFQQAVEQANASIEKYNGLLREGAQAEKQNADATKANTETKKASLVEQFKNGIADKHSKWTVGLNAVATAFTTLGLAINKTTDAGRISSGVFTAVGGTIQTIGAGARLMAGDVTALLPLLTGVMNIFNGIGIAIESPTEKLERLNKEAEQLSNEAKKARAEYRTLDSTIKKVNELKEKRYESVEAAEEYQSAINDLADTFPALIGGFDETGNAILDAAAQERLLANARKESAKATYEAAMKEYDAAKEEFQQNVTKINSKDTGFTTSDAEGIRTSLLFDRESSDEVTKLGKSWEQEGALFRQNALDYLNETNKNNKLYTAIQAKLDDTSPLVGESLSEYLNRFYNDYPTWTLNSQEQEKFDDWYKNITKESSLEALKKPWSNFEEQISKSSIKVIDDFARAAEQFTKSDKTSKEGRVAFNDMKEAYDNIWKTYKNDKDAMKKAGIDVEAVKEYEDTLNDWIKAYEELDKINEAFETDGTAVAAAYQSLQGVGKNYIENSSSLMSVVTSAIKSAVPQESTWADFIKSDSGKEDVEKSISTADKFYNSLMGRYTESGEELTQVLDKMLSDSSSYNADDILKYFSEYSQSGEFQTMLINHYSQLSTDLYTNLDNYLGQQENTKGISRIKTEVAGLKLTNHQLVTDESAFLTDLAKQIVKLDAAGYTDAGNKIAQEGIKLFEAIEAVEDRFVQNNISDLVRKNGITTNEGIQKTRAAIEAMTFEDQEQKTNILNQLDALNELIHSNINLSIQSATSEFLTAQKSTSENLNKALKSGLSLQEVDELITQAQNLGITISTSEFQTSGDKLVLTADAFNRYWTQLINANNVGAKKWNDAIDKADKLLNGTLDSADVELQQFIQSSFGVDITDKDWGTKLKTAVDQVKINKERFEWYNANAARQLAQAWNWEQGNYFNPSQLNDVGEPVYKSVFENLKALLSGIETDAKSHFGKNTEQRTLLDSLYESYNTLISDVLSKGIENIHLDDYTGIINDKGHKTELQAALKNGYESFITQYAKFAGASVDETNDWLAQAIKKDKERVDPENLKKLQFISSDKFAASLEDLNELAKQYDINLSDLTKNWNQKLGKYIVNLQQLPSEIINAENYSSIIQDSVNAFFSDLNKLINNALKGALSAADSDSLQAQIEALGITDFELNFTATAEGLKLSEKSAIALYTKIREINSLAAQTTFKNLMDSMTESNELYGSVASITGRIKELQDAINKADSNVSDERLDEYKAELSVAKEILAVRSATQEDSSFDFMSNKIPGSHNNPLNFYSSMQKMMKTIADGTKVTGRKGKKQWVEGFIDYKDFYNIATELGELAKLGAPIEVAGITLDGSMEKTAALIQKGAESLTTIDTGDLKVSLQAVGLDILGGANALTKGVDAGMKEFARSQIKMLDGAIAMLEAIVTMQSVSDSTDDLKFDVGADGIFDPSDLFSEEGIIKAQSYLDWIQKFSNIKIDGKNLGKALTELANDGEKGAEKVFQFFSTLSTWLTNPDYDFTNFAVDLQTLLNTTFSDAKEIKIGEGIFSNLNISASSMTPQLVKKINDAYEKEIKQGPERTALVNDIKKQNEKLGKSLEALFDKMPTLDFKAALNILSQLEEHGKVQSKNGKYEAYYGDKLIGDKYTTQDAANAALLEYIEKQNNSSDLENKFKPEVQTLKISGSTEIVYMHKIAEEQYTAEYHGATSTGTQKEVEAQIQKWMSEFAEGNGSFTYKIEGGTATVAIRNGVEYRHIVNDDKSQYYESDGKQYNKEAFEAFLEEKGKSENVTVTIVDDTITVMTNTGVQYEKRVKDDGNVTYTVGGQEYSQQTLEKYLAERSLAKENGNNVTLIKSGKDELITVTTDTKIQYRMKVDANGEITYEAPDGTPYNNKEAFIGYLEASKILNGYDKITYNDDASATEVIVNGKKIQIKYNTDTKTYQVEGAAPAENLSDAIANYNKTAEKDATLTKDASQTINIESGTITITPDKIVLANVSETGEISLTEPINKITGTANELEIQSVELVSQKQTEEPFEIELQNLKGKGNGTIDAGDCTLQFTEQGTAKVMMGETEVAEIPVGELTGEGTVTNCKLTYNLTTDSYSIANPGEGIAPIEIKSEWLKGQGTLTAENCSISLNENTLTLTSPEGTSISVSIPPEQISAVGNITKEKCTITLNPSGELVISNESGKSYTVTIPQESLAGVAELLEAKVTWTDGEKFNTDAIIPQNAIDLGVIEGLAKVNVKYELLGNEQQAIDISSKIQNKGSNLIQELGWDTGDVITFFDDNHRSNLDSKTGKEVENYIQQLQQLQKQGKALSSIDLSNLETLGTIGSNFNFKDQDGNIKKLEEVISSLLAVDQTLKEKNSSSELVSSISELSTISSENIEALAVALERVQAAVSALQGIPYAELASQLNSLNVSNPSTETVEIETGTTEISVVTTTDTTAMVEEVQKAKEEATETPATQKIEGNAEEMIETGKDAVDQVEAMKASIKITATSSATSVIMSIKAALDKLVNGGPYKVTVQASVSQAKGNIGRSKTPINNKETLTTNYISATGTVGLAKSKGTLMGELGPELVVSKGRYFVVGQSGPEMVDLDDDAIVFNHLQTQSLLTKGMSNGRGRAVTNEHNAVSFATGNVDGGPAMANAAAVLANLKQLRAMWEAMLGASVSDLAGAGGGGGGGGGGNKIVDPKAWVKTVERWYNLTQEIAKLEKDITHEETLRSKLQSDFNKNGKHYYQSQKQSLSALKQQIAAQEQLNLSRQDYYTKRIDALKNEPLGKLYTFDENGQMHFRDDVTMNGQKGVMNFLTNLMGFDENGKANYTNEQKYNILKRYGFDEYMKYNSNGEQILLDADHSGDVTDEERETYYQQATEAWRDRMDSYAQETQSLWDSIKEGENSLLELQTSQNELLQEMRDNQMDLEDEVLKAIEDMRQREIDALQDERDKLEESTGKYIQGLSDALNKEQEMYNNQEQENDLNQQRRRLAILQRSGGSAADIANLQNEINNNERSQYFDLQQQQIDAIQNASDLQIERMDDQIQLMTETLEYQKEYGLLWGDVYQVMNDSAARITNFIMGANSEFWAKSPLGSATEMNEILFKAEQWEGFREDVKDVSTDVAALAFATREEMKANDYKIYNDAMTKEFGANYDKSGKYKGIFESVYEETGDLTKASAAARAEYQKDKKAEEDKKKAEEAKKPKPTSTPTPAPTTNNSSNNNTKKTETKMKATIKYSTGSGASGTAVGYGIDTTESSASAVAYKYALSKVPKNAFNMSPAIYTKIYKAGGMNRETGPAWLDGTKKKPEAVLNAAQTKVLRDNILSNKPNSLVTLLNTYNEAYKDGISVAPQEASEQLIIENATVNMNVQQIANDYDARRAGEQALNEMMRIARKTSAANSIRR